MQFLSISGSFAIAILGGIFPVSAASAEPLDLTCKAASGARSQHLMIDLASSLISNEASGGGRPWAARITGDNISIANHYVFDRQTGTLHRTDMTRSESGREVVNAACQKAS